jgi:hypothetical protein
VNPGNQLIGVVGNADGMLIVYGALGEAITTSEINRKSIKRFQPVVTS